MDKNKAFSVKINASIRIIVDLSKVFNNSIASWDGLFASSYFQFWLELRVIKGPNPKTKPEVAFVSIISSSSKL